MMSLNKGLWNSRQSEAPCDYSWPSAGVGPALLSSVSWTPLYLGMCAKSTIHPVGSELAQSSPPPHTVQLWDWTCQTKQTPVHCNEVSWRKKEVEAPECKSFENKHAS